MRKVIKGGDVNFSSYPDTFPSSLGKVEGVGYEGTNNNVLAAEGVYAQEGGACSYGFGKPIGDSFGSSGTGEIVSNEASCNVPRSTNDFPSKFINSNITSGAIVGGSHRRQIGCYRPKSKHYRTMHRKRSRSMRSRSMRSRSKRSRSMRSRSMRKTAKRMRSSMSKRKTAKRMSKRMRSRSMRSRSMRSRSKRSRSMRKRGGAGQPYSNIPIAFGQTFKTSLSSNESALASPTPLTPVNNCTYAK